MPGNSLASASATTFEPERLLVDPDVTVLMLERQKAEVQLKAAAEAVAIR